MDKVEKRWFGYFILRPWGRLVHRTVHKHLEINGLENIPTDKPIILAPNHQNALMDAMAMVCTLKQQPIFLGRADIFKKKIISKILIFLKIIPVYRIRDGKENLNKNEETFNHCARILKANKVLCLFPEGQHIGMKSMVVHKKAIPRIVFLVGEKTDYTLDIQIIPVGLNYSHYYNFRRDLVVNYGKPIPVKPFYKIVQEKGERDATLELRNAVFNALTNEMVQVPDKPNYAIYEEAFDLYRKQTLSNEGLKCNATNRVKAEQLLVQKIKLYFETNADEKETIKQKVEEYRKLKSTLNLDERIVTEGKIRFVSIVLRLLLTIVISPIVVYGALLNGWVFYLSRYPMRKNIKDPQFYSSISYAISLFSYTIWYIILIIVFVNIFNWLIGIALVLILIPTGIIAWETGQMLQRMANRIRLGSYSKTKKETFNTLYKTRAELISFIKKTFN